MSSDHDEQEHEDADGLPVDDFFIDVMDAEMTPPKWVIEDLLPVGLTIVAGPPKLAHKSTQIIAMCALVAGGDNDLYPPYMRRVHREGTVLLLSGEADAGVVKHMMLKDMNTRGLKADGSFRVANDPFMFRLDKEDDREHLFQWLKARGPKLVAADPFRNFHQADEKDSGAIFDILKPLRHWAVRSNSAFVLAHHTNKINPNEKRDYTEMDLRGTGAMFGAADAVIIITPVDENALVVKVKATFKRGKSWERTLRLAAYQFKDRPATELMDAVTEKVYEAYKAGAENMEEVGKQVGVRKERVIACVDMLIRNGVLVKDGKKVRVK